MLESFDTGTLLLAMNIGCEQSAKNLVGKWNGPMPKVRAESQAKRTLKES